MSIWEQCERGQIIHKMLLNRRGTASIVFLVMIMIVITITIMMKIIIIIIIIYQFILRNLHTNVQMCIN